GHHGRGLPAHRRGRGEARQAPRPGRFLAPGHDLAGYRGLREVVSGGKIGDPLMVHCAHRNAAVPDSYTTEMAITETVIHEIDVLRWLLDDDYVAVQVFYPHKTRNASKHLRDPQLVMMETAKGIRIDVEV